MKRINKFSRSIKLYWDRSKLLLSYLPLFALVALIWYRFRKVLADPNAYLFSTSGDGLKNYYNFAHYLKNNDGLITSGFNYPYGDHLLYTDSHPLWVFLLDQIDTLVPIAPSATGILNYAMIIGALVGALLIFHLLRHLGIPVWFASLATFCITLLSPQWDRMGGHLSLSYLFVVPGMLMLILNYARRPGLKWAFYAGIYIICTGGLHAYFLPMHLLLIMGFIFCQILISRKSIWKYTPLLMAGLIPLLLFQIVQASTDVVMDRPTEMYGFYAYTASPASILIPRLTWTESLPYLMFNDRIRWEGRAYLGLPVVLLLLSSFFLLLRSPKIFWKNIQETLPPLVISLLGSATLLLLFSMCFPFRLGFEWLVDILKPLKQIRALGRFTWPFYYIAGIVAVYFYHSLLSAKSRDGLRPSTIMVSFILGTIWVIEASRFFLVSTDDLFQPNILVTEVINLDEEVFAEHQAILPLPLIAKGTDKLTRQDDESGMNAAIPISFQSGLSMVATVSPRTSHHHSLSLIQLISNPLLEKERLLDMDQRPLLLVTSRGGSLTSEERNLVDASTPLYEDGNVLVASLPLSAFDHEAELALNLYNERTTQEQNFFWVDYDSLETIVAFEGAGALQILENPTRILDKTNNISPHLELSCWIYIDPDQQPMPHFLMETSDRDVWSEVGYSKVIDQTNVWGKWVRIAFEFDCAMGESYRLTSSHAPFLMDNLLIRPAKVDVFITRPQHLIYNNYLLRPN